MSLDSKVMACKSAEICPALQNPHFKVFSGSDPEVEKAPKRVSKAVGQEGDVTCQEV